MALITSRRAPAAVIAICFAIGSAGLVKLSRVTGEKRYLDLAKAMLDRRG